MPIYEYECGACGEEHEILQKMSEGALRKCPACGALRLRRKISRSAFHLKGEGWYVTDYGKNGSKKDKEKETASDTSSKSDSKAESKSSDKTSSSKGKSESSGSKKSESAKSSKE